jgi:acetyl-CoA carboxylase beta subunit
METKLFLDDGRTETDEGVDYIRECPECNQFRHKSWFRAGVRGCAKCEHFKSMWIDQLAYNLMIADQQRPN